MNNNNPVTLFGIEFVTPWHAAYCGLAAAVCAYGFGYAIGCLVFLCTGAL
jgi:hypothetical protein